MPPMRRISAAAARAFLLGVLMLGGCRVTPVDFSTSEPPGDYGRPALVRGAARAGSYVGGAAGVVVSVPLWPLTKGLNLLVDEPLGYTETEWAFLPLQACTALGHYAIGLPAEVLYYAFWGAWVTAPPATDFDHVPQASDPLSDPPK